MFYFYIFNKDSNFHSIFSSNSRLLSLTSTVMQKEGNSLTENICTLVAWETHREGQLRRSSRICRCRRNTLESEVSYNPYIVYFFPQLYQHYSEKQYSANISMLCSPLHSSSHQWNKWKTENNCSSMIPWASHHDPSDLATRVFHRTLHTSRIKRLRFCPSSDVRVAQACEAEANSVCFIPAESF